jgi:molybdopterin-binding protein
MALFTTRQAAAQLGVGYSTLKQWIYQGAVRTVKTRGGHHRIPAEEVDRLLAAAGGPPDHRRQPPAAAPTAIVSLSPRNQLRGIIEEVRAEGVLAQVRLRVGQDTITAVITRDAVTALGLRRGKPAIALVKSTEVMIACEPDHESQKAQGRRRKTKRQKGKGIRQNAAIRTGSGTTTIGSQRYHPTRANRFFEHD